MNKLFLTSQIDFNQSSAPSKFEGIAYNGGKVFNNIVIDLSSIKIDKSIPLLFQHDHERVIGVVENITNTGNNLISNGAIFSDFDQLAIDIVNKSLRGIKYQQSIGLYDFNLEDINDNAVINNQEFNAPITVLKNGLIREVSIVSLGADNKTNAIFFAENLRDIIMSQEEITKLQTDITNLTSEVKKATLRAEKAELELATKAKQERVNIVNETFKLFNVTLEVEQIAHFLNLNKETFDGIIANIRLLKPAINPALLTEIAVGDITVSPKRIDLSQIYNSRKLS
jgi:hypothetical protein